MTPETELALEKLRRAQHHGWRLGHFLSANDTDHIAAEWLKAQENAESPAEA